LPQPLGGTLASRRNHGHLSTRRLRSVGSLHFSLWNAPKLRSMTSLYRTARGVPAVGVCEHGPLACQCGIRNKPWKFQPPLTPNRWVHRQCFGPARRTGCRGVRLQLVYGFQIACQTLGYSFTRSCLYVDAFCLLRLSMVCVTCLRFESAMSSIPQNAVQHVFVRIDKVAKPNLYCQQYDDVSGCFQ